MRFYDIGPRETVSYSSDYSTRWASYKENAQQFLRSFSTQELKSLYKKTLIPHFKSFTSFSLFQKWMPKLEIVGANDLGLLLLFSFPGRQVQFTSKSAIL
jgi:hypothetical protein